MDYGASIKRLRVRCGHLGQFIFFLGSRIGVDHSHAFHQKGWPQAIGNVQNKKGWNLLFSLFL